MPQFPVGVPFETLMLPAAPPYVHQVCGKPGTFEPYRSRKLTVYAVPVGINWSENAIEQTEVFDPGGLAPADSGVLCEYGVQPETVPCSVSAPEVDPI